MDVRKIREELCLTQTEFAKLLGVSMQTVSNWECSQNGISIKSKRKILELCRLKGIQSKK